MVGQIIAGRLPLVESDPRQCVPGMGPRQRNPIWPFVGQFVVLVADDGSGVRRHTEPLAMPRCLRNMNSIIASF